MVRSIPVVTLLLIGSLCVHVRAEDPKKTEPVDFRKLKELLPSTLLGLKRANAEGQKTKVGDFSMSTATATYEGAKKDGDNADADAPHIEVTIVDYSGTQAGDLAAAWAQADIDKETDGGYEKTLKVAGNPAYETWQSEGKSGALQLYVGKRYIVTVNATGLEKEKTVEAAKALPLDKLAALK